jgi:hypothetical protein
MKTIKQIFQYLYGRPMFPYEVDNMEIMINEIANLLIISVILSVFFIWVKLFFG